jgi:hypothetical protein
VLIGYCDNQSAGVSTSPCTAEIKYIESALCRIQSISAIPHFFPVNISVTNVIGHRRYANVLNADFTSHTLLWIRPWRVEPLNNSTLMGGRDDERTTVLNLIAAYLVHGTDGEPLVDRLS